MKVLLISANTLTVPYPVYPMGLDYVAGAMADRHDVHLLDMNLIAPNRLGERLLALAPEIIGIALRNVDNTDAAGPEGFLGAYRQLVAEIRRHSTAPIVLGGTGFSIFPREILSALGAEYGIVGEGERMADLVDALASGGNVEALPGVLVPDAPVAWPPGLSGALPRRFDGAGEHVAFYLRRGGMLNLQTKRGCPLRCIYCTYPHIEGRTFRRIPPASVAQTAVALQAAGARYLFIADSAFNADVQQSLAVADAFIKAGLSIPWGAFLAPMKMPDGYFERLKAAGLTHAEFGTESLSNRILSAYGKPFDRAQVLAAHDAALCAGLHVAHYFLLGGPGETPDTLETTLSHVDKLKKSVLFLFCGMRIYPHTDLYKLALAEGQVTADQDLLPPVFYESPAIGSPEILRRVRARGGDKINWVIGAGSDANNRIVSRMYDRGRTGPLWEYLIR